MKSEERHRLQETELAKWGRSARDFWENFLRESGKIIVIGLGVVCLVAGIVLWWLSSSAAAEAERWKEVISASFDSDPSRSIELFAQTANKYPNHPAGEWAALMEAERALSQGIQYSRTNRKASAQELVQAREAYAKLADSKSEAIQERRLFGLARCLETLAGVDVSEVENGENVEGVEEAVAAYEQFLERFPESIFASFAENRVTDLKAGSTQDFYAWYREQNPNPDDLKTPEDGRPQDGLPQGHPPIDGGSSAEPMPDLKKLEEQFNNWLEGADEKNPFENLEEPAKSQDQPAGTETPTPKPGEGPALTPPKANDE